MSMEAILILYNTVFSRKESASEEKVKEIVKKAEIATNCEGIFCLQFEFESGRAWYTTLEEENMFKILKVFFSWCHCLNSYAGKTIELRDWELIFLGTHFKDGILEFDVIKDSKSEHMCVDIKKIKGEQILKGV